MLLRELEVEKYWSFPSSYDKEKRKLEINKMIDSGNYYYQLKTDGNYSAFIVDFDNEKRLISRGISKVTGEFGRLENKVFFFNDIIKVFNKPTRIMGEIWLDGAVDKNIGSILRCGDEKSKCIQNEKYYFDYASSHKLSAKDIRDIENNPFRNHQLKWRVFDIWYYDGLDLMSTPWIERQKYAKEAVQRINNPLVTYVPYYELDDTFYDKLNELFANGEEGVVCYCGDGKPEPGKRTAHKTLKVKRELENLIDCFIIGTEPSTRNYSGKDIGNWDYWENSRTGDKLQGKYFGDFQSGASIIPVTKGYWYNLPGAIYTAIYDNNGNEMPLCKVSGLTDEFKFELRDNFEKYNHCPVTIGGMALSTSNGLSVRHPYLHSIRLNDIDIKDCTLSKILSEQSI